MTESHVAAYSALVEREHLCRERCRVVIASVENGHEIHTYMYITVPGRERNKKNIVFISVGIVVCRSI